MGIKKMTDHTSLFNRMYRHYYNVSVRPEYREGLTSRLDASKLTPKHEPDDYIIFTKFEYTRPETGGPLGRQEVGTCTFKEIIQRVCHSLEKAYDQASDVKRLALAPSRKSFSEFATASKKPTIRPLMS